MIPFAIEQGFIKPEHLNVFRQVAAAVNALPSGLTCHEVCERVATEIDGVEHVRGKFNHFDHSWLVIPRTRIVIDAYPWACGSGPFIVDCQTGSPWTILYKEYYESHPSLVSQAVGEARRDEGGLWPLEQIAIQG